MDNKLIEKYYLSHHGIKGQRWGVRRFQNPDGSLTSQGKKRYYNDDGSPTVYGRNALRQHKIGIHDNRQQQEKLHNSKLKKPDVFANNDYLLSSSRVSKGKKYIKQIKKEIMDGYVTSFVEDSKGNITSGKTKKGVVIRDKSGNRITAYDYNEAQKLVYKRLHQYISTGMW